ncbi:MAG: hypothetical protein A2085_09280 [Gemmatimonadetes bacterium GWC2_71_10]|nr:MAG: hypothetical protein A2085_09280 [Gemmatimonadetes bacterium GWC2_71_10]
MRVAIDARHRRIRDGRLHRRRDGRERACAAAPQVRFGLRHGGHALLEVGHAHLAREVGDVRPALR